MPHTIPQVDYGVETDPTITTVCTRNDEAFARLLRLYARPGQIIVDPTFGNGVFWKAVDRSQYTVLATDWQTDPIDLRRLPYPDGSADVLVLDPPYRFTPLKNARQDDVPGHGKVDGLYNLNASKLYRIQNVLELYEAGMKEAWRVLKHGGFLIVKCQDTIQDGRQVWVHVLLMQKADAEGYACRDLLIVTPPSVLATRWERQRHLRKAHSYFLVFRKGSSFPFGIPAVCKRNRKAK